MVIDLKKDKDYSKIQSAAEIIKQGGLVLFPTETVYGIGADGLNKDAVSKIFKAKGRAQDNPLILHVSNMNMVRKIAMNITDAEFMLMEKFWPGPFTIILPKKEIVPDIVTGGLDTVAVRMPSNEVARKLIEFADIPIAAPSANISGKPSGTCIEDIYEELVDKMDCVIDGGKCTVGIESTVVKVKNGQVNILRPGKVTKEEIEALIPEVIVSSHTLEKIKSDEKVESPGMKYKHYAPQSRCVLVYSEDENKMIEKIKELKKNYVNPLVICCDEHEFKFDTNNILKYGSKLDMDSISSNLFSILRKADKFSPDIVFIEGVEKKRVGLAIMNRLIRACSYEYVEI